jgi:hypothetical protein
VQPSRHAGASGIKTVLAGKAIHGFDHAPGVFKASRLESGSQAGGQRLLVRHH